MRKVILIIGTLLMVISLVFLSGCGSKNAVAEEVPEDEEAITEEQITADEDGDKVFITETIMSDTPHFYLRRGGQYYDLNSTIYPSEPAGMLGLPNQEGEGDSFRMFHKLYTDIHHIGGQLGFHAYGEVPIPTLQKGDEVIATIPRDVPKLRLYKVDFYGWCPHFMIKGDLKSPEYWVGESLVDNARDLQIDDGSGNICEDPYNLERGKEYRISWYKGSTMELEESQWYADCQAYVFSSFKPEDINNFWNYEFYESFDYEIEPKITEGGEAVYDLSEVSPGIYKIDDDIVEDLNGGLIKIK